MAARRTALLIRCTADEAATIRRSSRSEHRTVSGCLMHLLERSLWIEEKFAKGFAPTRVAEGKTQLSRVKGGRTGILLRCSAEEAARIRKAAARRNMSISAFVLFSFYRHQRAQQQLEMQRQLQQRAHDTIS